MDSLTPPPHGYFEDALDRVLLAVNGDDPGIYEMITAPPRCHLIAFVLAMYDWEQAQEAAQ